MFDKLHGLYEGRPDVIDFRTQSYRKSEPAVRALLLTPAVSQALRSMFPGAFIS